MNLCPWLGLTEGTFLQISNDAYRRYAAAVRTYGHEIALRVFGPDTVGDLDLSAWQQNYLLGYE